MLLSLEAYRRVEHRSLGERFEARDAMVTILQHNARLTTVLDTGARVRAVAFSPSGKTLATAGNSRTIRLWDVATGKSASEVDFGGAKVSTLAFSADGKTLAAADGHGNVWLEGLGGGHLPARHLRHSSCYPVVGLAFTTDGRTVATGGDHGSIRVWNAVTGKPVGRTLQPDGACPKPNESLLPGKEASSLAFSEHSRELIVADGVAGDLTRFDLAHSRLTGDPFDFAFAFAVNFYDVYHTALSRDGGMLAAAGTGVSGDQEIRLWDLSADTPLDIVLHQADPVSSVALSLDGEALASASDNGKIRVWDVARRPPLGEPFEAQRDPVASVTFSADGAALAAVGDTSVSGASRTSVTLWDPARRIPLAKPLEIEFVPEGVAFGPHGDLLAPVLTGETLAVRNVFRRTQVGKSMALGDTSVSVALSPDGSTVATGRDDGTVQLWDVARGTPRGQPSRADRYGNLVLAFSPDGGELSSISYQIKAHAGPLEPPHIRESDSGRSNGTVS